MLLDSSCFWPSYDHNQVYVISLSFFIITWIFSILFLNGFQETKCSYIYMIWYVFHIWSDSLSCFSFFPKFSRHEVGVTHVLVTGGAGYIGSHAALRLLKDSHRVTIVVYFSLSEYVLIFFSNHCQPVIRNLYDIINEKWISFCDRTIYLVET